MRNSIFLIWTLLLIGILDLHAQEKDKHEFLIEADPLPFIMGGVAAHFGWSPKKSEHLTIGLAFVAQIKYPDAFIELDARNKDMGWGVKINQGMGLWSQYYFRKKNDGWFAGLQLFTQEMELTNENFAGETDRTNTVLIALQGGYLWYPFSRQKFYLKPWAGIGYQSVISGTIEPDKVDPDLNVGNLEYHLTPLMPFATVHLGYRF
jgi:hypothetical protein